MELTSSTFFAQSQLGFGKGVVRWPHNQLQLAIPGHGQGYRPTTFPQSFQLPMYERPPETRNHRGEKALGTAELRLALFSNCGADGTAGQSIRKAVLQAWSPQPFEMQAFLTSSSPSCGVGDRDFEDGKGLCCRVATCGCRDQANRQGSGRPCIALGSILIQAAKAERRAGARASWFANLFACRGVEAQLERQRRGGKGEWTDGVPGGFAVKG